MVGGAVGGVVGGAIGGVVGRAVGGVVGGAVGGVVGGAVGGAVFTICDGCSLFTSTDMGGSTGDVVIGRGVTDETDPPTGSGRANIGSRSKNSINLYKGTWTSNTSTHMPHTHSVHVMG